MGERLTLMCAMMDHTTEYAEGEKGDQRWLLADNIREALPPQTQEYYDNWRSLAEPRMRAGLVANKVSGEAPSEIPADAKQRLAQLSGEVLEITRKGSRL